MFKLKYYPYNPAHPPHSNRPPRTAIPGHHTTAYTTCPPPPHPRDVHRTTQTRHHASPHGHRTVDHRAHKNGTVYLTTNTWRGQATLAFIGFCQICFTMLHGILV